jgi:hypothetical protein
MYKLENSMRKKALALFCCGESKYFNLAHKLISKAQNMGEFSIVVYTSDPLQFTNPEIITLKYDSSKFSYHHKIHAIQKSYLLGFDEILYLDADLLINDDSFFNLICEIKFDRGINYTREGQPKDMEAYISNKEGYKSKLSHLGLNYKSIGSIFEDVFYFNFADIEKDKVFNFFKIYEEISELKHSYDRESKYHRFGDHEGYTIAISAIKSKIPIQGNYDFLDSLKMLRASNHGYDGVMDTITSEIDFIFPYRKDSPEREKNLLTVLSYYSRHFPKNRFIISEQGLEKSKFNERYDHFFEKKDLPHNQSKCINAGIKESTKKVICVIDTDIVLINYHNIYEATKDIYIDECDYALPYTECVDLPEFEFRSPWGKPCIGGIFVIDREKFVSLGMNDESFEGWGREDDARHEKLISAGLKFKRYSGNIVHMWHPPQEYKEHNAETNMSLLSKIRDDISSSN